MNLTLNVLDRDGIPLDVSALTVASQTIAVTDAVTDTFTGLTLEEGNDYDIVFPADATTDPLAASTVEDCESAKYGV